MRPSTVLRPCVGILLLAGSVAGAPELTFPLNSQLPPVAYATKDYSYTFAESTFQTSDPPITYSIEDAPPWLSIDSTTRTLRGTPALADVGAATFQLIAADGNGETATSATLVITDQTPLDAGQSIDESLRSAGQVQEPSSLFLQPLTPFTISFSQNIFSGASSSTTYYAVSDDNSPLPSWVQFNAQVLRMTGLTPTIVNSSAQQQSYGFRIVATNVPGFAEASVGFVIVIARTLFLFQLGSATVNVTRGQQFRSESFRSSLYLDGQPISDENLMSVKSDAPSWTDLDTNTISLNGDVPQDFFNQTVTITAEDRFGDQAVLAVVLQSTFSVSVENSTTALNISAYPGEYLSFPLPQSITQNADDITLDTDESTRWLSYTSSNSTLHGQVPETNSTQPMILSLLVTLNGSQVRYPVNIVLQEATRPSSSSTGSARSEPSTTATGETGASDANSTAQPRHILAIVLVTVLTAIAVLAIILFCLCWRRRRAKKLEEKEHMNDDLSSSARGKRSGSVSRPPEGGNNAAVAAADGGPMNDETNRKHTPVKAPKLELPWAPDSLKKARLRFTRKSQNQPQESFDSTWGTFIRGSNHPPGPVTAQVGAGAADLRPVPVPFPPPGPYTHSRRRSEAERKQSSRLAQIQRQRLEREPLSNHPERGLSVNKRASGLPNRSHSAAGVGHGSVILSPTPANASAPWRHSRMPTRSSWATTFGSKQGKENPRPSVASANLEQFPFPPSSSGQYGPVRNEHDSRETQSSHAAMTDTKASLEQSSTMPVLRLVSPSSSESREIDLPSDNQSFNSKHRRYHEDRARADLEAFSHFSNGSNSRTPSLSRFIPGTNAFRRTSSTFGHSQSQGGDRNMPNSEWGGPGPATMSIPSSPPRPPTRGEPSGSGNWSKWPLTSDAESSMGALRGLSIISPKPQKPGRQPVLTRAISASSGQFSSAMSSSAASEWEDVEPHASMAVERRPSQMSGANWGYAYAYRGMSASDAIDERLYELGVGQRGEKQWTSTSSSGPNSAVVSPRLPFDGGKESTGDEALTRTGTGFSRVGSSRRTSGVGDESLKFADRRQRVVSVDGKSEDGGEGSGERVSRAPGSRGKGKGKALAWGGRERSRRGSLRFI